LSASKKLGDLNASVVRGDVRALSPVCSFKSNFISDIFKLEIIISMNTFVTLALAAVAAAHSQMLVSDVPLTKNA
jgi:hypothetical protein